ncbi:major facilitator superfamily domain-containing protein [Fennellomyces sp. T-0311]|nr:major facilitator superfamily domain-containing protein [Fennellomyces sp. T-0311]
MDYPWKEDIEAARKANNGSRSLYSNGNHNDSQSTLPPRLSTDTEKTRLGDYGDDKNNRPSDHDDQEQQSPDQQSIQPGEAGDTALANAPWKYKAIALVTALMLPVGSHFSTSALSAMKSSVRDNLHIDNTRYGVLSSSVSIINTIFPIIGGMFIDIFGSVWGTMAVNGLVLLGSLLTALAARFASFPLIIVGRVIFGIGGGLIVTMQESLLSKWFRTQSLSIAIGMQLSVSRLATFLGTLVANPIAERTGTWVWPFWLAFIICGFSISMNLVYALIVRHLEGDNVVNKDDLTRLKKKKSFKYHSILKFPLFFWHVIVIEFLFASVWSSFQTISTDLVQTRFGTTGVLAGYTASASQVVPIIATPLLGVFMDIFGHRIKILTLSGIFMIISAILLGWTYVNAVVGMVFYSFSLAFGTLPMITSIAMIMESSYVGTGLGIYKSSNNVGTAILDIIIGRIQDQTAGQSYSGVMTLYLVLACIGTGLILTLLVTQRIFLFNLLEVSRRKREERMKEKNDREVELNRQGRDSYEETEVKAVNIFFVGLFVAALLVAWILFFVYAAVGKVKVT